MVADNNATVGADRDTKKEPMRTGEIGGEGGVVDGAKSPADAGGSDEMRENAPKLKRSTKRRKSGREREEEEKGGRIPTSNARVPTGEDARPSSAMPDGVSVRVLAAVRPCECVALPVIIE